MTIVHIVLFEFKPDTSPEAIRDVCARMLGLKDTCLHPTSNKPYLRTSVGGKDNSPEGRQDGITHAFVVEFESVQDRDYYITEDPAHTEFKTGIREVLQKAQVIDFAPGVF